MIGGTWHEATRVFSGRTVDEIIKSRSLANPPNSSNQTIKQSNNQTIPASPGELVCRILELDGCKTGAFFFGMSEGNLDKILARPWIVPGSDASLRAPWGPLGADHPHPRAYATMPEFYRRLRALGVSREAAVARMTAVPADRFGIVGRGRIAAGAFADIAVWREDEFKSSATYAEPHRFATGMKSVMVNGIITYADGALSGRRGGRFLERR